MKLNLQLTKPQAEFIKMEKRYRLLAAGYGAGKSEAMVNAALIDAASAPGAVVAMYSPTNDLVRLITAPRLIEKLDGLGVEYKYNKQENTIQTISPHWGNFLLRSLDNPDRIVGYESYTAHVDELDTLPHKQAETAWNRVIARNRQKPKRVPHPFNQASAYTTPEGFKFAHWRWVKNANDDYGIVQAPSYTNPYLPDGYIQSLRDSYPEALADAYIEGRFVNLTSGSVYSAFDRSLSDSDEQVFGGERLYVGMDFNVGKMAAVIFVRRGETLHAVDELVDLYDTKNMCEALVSRYDGHTIIVYPDASGRSRKTVNASQSDLAIIRQYGFTVRAPKRNPVVKDRINAMNAAFENGTVRVNSRACPEFVTSLEQQAYDKNGEPDKQSGHDHLNDAAGYCVAYEKPVIKPVSDVRIGFAI